MTALPVNRYGGRTIRSLAPFAFRSVAYGENMTKQGKLSHHHRAAQAFADLADILELPDSAMSIHGLVALELGAAVNSPAWYHPSTRTIQTSRSSLGVIAHEWFHAIDHYLGGESYHSSNGGPVGQACEKSGFSTRKFTLPNPQHWRYYRQPHELAARAFEGYVLRKLLYRGWVSELLVSPPYNDTMPTEQEAQSIDRAIEKMIGRIR